MISEYGSRDARCWTSFGRPLLVMLLLLGNDCASNLDECLPSQMTVTVGQNSGQLQATISVPVLRVGASMQFACGVYFQGYESYIEVSCIGAILRLDSSRCTPAGCKVGQVAPVVLAGMNFSIALTTHNLAHGDEDFVSCSKILSGYTESIKLTCSRAVLTADGSKCRLPFGDAMTVWRIVNGDYLAGSWRVFELSFYTSTDCKGGKLSGNVVVSSEDPTLNGYKQNAFDQDLDSAWVPYCANGCLERTAWIGLTLNQPSAYVRCLMVRQSAVSCCGTKRLRLEVWDGTQFQLMKAWDTTALKRVTHSFELPLPITCVSGQPQGKGVIHNCVGPPVVGQQEGAICVAECDPEKYYGYDTKYECKADGQYKGVPPTCYELKFWVRVSLMTSFLVTFLFFGWQYKFWCMHRKMRIGDEDCQIPREMKGKWLEYHGRQIWDVLEKGLAAQDQQHKSLFADPDEGKNILGRTSVVEQQGGKRSTGQSWAMGGELTSRTDRTSDSVSVSDMIVVHGRARELPPSTDGLCTPCVDPDLLWACCLCPVCRIADTWHTLGTPKCLSYPKIFFLYLCCPCCWPCLNYYGRMRVRLVFGIPLEPHRDCLIHCCCCCCCSPCGLCQEARLADAPTTVCYARRQQRDAIERGLTDD